MALPAAVTVPEDVIWQRVEDRVVVLELGSGEYHALNDSGSLMWMLLVDTGDVPAVLDRLRASYDADEAILRRDLAAFIAELVDNGLLATAPP
jgi:hypothetical protein